MQSARSSLRELREEIDAENHHLMEWGQPVPSAPRVLFGRAKATSVQTPATSSTKSTTANPKTTTTTTMTTTTMASMLTSSSAAVSLRTPSFQFQGRPKEEGAAVRTVAGPVPEWRVRGMLAEEQRRLGDGERDLAQAAKDEARAWKERAEALEAQLKERQHHTHPHPHPHHPQYDPQPQLAPRVHKQPAFSVRRAGPIWTPEDTPPPSAGPAQQPRGGQITESPSFLVASPDSATNDSLRQALEAEAVARTDAEGALMMVESARGELERDLDEARAQLSSAEEEAASLAARNRALEAQVAALEEQARAAEASRARAEEQLAAAKRASEARLRDDEERFLIAQRIQEAQMNQLSLVEAEVQSLRTRNEDLAQAKASAARSLVDQREAADRRAQGLLETVAKYEAVLKAQEGAYADLSASRDSLAVSLHQATVALAAAREAQAHAERAAAEAEARAARVERAEAVTESRAASLAAELAALRQDHQGAGKAAAAHLAEARGEVRRLQAELAAAEARFADHDGADRALQRVGDLLRAGIGGTGEIQDPAEAARVLLKRCNDASRLLAVAQLEKAEVVAELTSLRQTQREAVARSDEALAELEVLARRNAELEARAMASDDRRHEHATDLASAETLISTLQRELRASMEQAALLIADNSALKRRLADLHQAAEHHHHHQQQQQQQQHQSSRRPAGAAAVPRDLGSIMDMESVYMSAGESQLDDSTAKAERWDAGWDSGWNSASAAPSAQAASAAPPQASPSPPPPPPAAKEDRLAAALQARGERLRAAAMGVRTVMSELMATPLSPLPITRQARSEFQLNQTNLTNIDMSY